MKSFEMESLLQKAKELDALADVVIKDKSVDKAANFISEDINKNVFLLTLIVKKNAELAARVAKEVVKKFPKEKQYLMCAIAMNVDGGNSEVVKKQQDNLSTFLVRELNSPENQVLSKETLCSLCRYDMRHSYYEYRDSEGNPIKTEQERCEKDKENIEYYLELDISAENLIQGVSAYVDSCVLPENVQALDHAKIRAVMDGLDISPRQYPLYKHLATKYSEWLMKKNAPGFDIMDNFLPDHYIFDYKVHDTYYRENARAILKELKTSEEIQKWRESLDKVPLDEFLGKVPGLKGINGDSSTVEIFVPASAALKYAKCRETYFPHQSVEECLNKSSKDIDSSTQFPRFLDVIAVAYALNKVVNSENSQGDKQKFQIMSRENGGR